MIQTVDSAKLARRLDEAGGRSTSCSKSSCRRKRPRAAPDPPQLPELIDAVRGCPNLRLLGLMTMPPWSEDPEASRPYFRRLRELARDARTCRSFPWGCRTIWRRPSRKAPPASAWARRCSASARSRDGRVSFRRCRRRAPAWPIMRRRCSRELRRHGTVEVAAGALRCRALPPGQQPRCTRRSTGARWSGPGVVVLHDAVLHHFFLGQLSEPDYVDEFVYNYGEWNRGPGARPVARARRLGFGPALLPATPCCSASPSARGRWSCTIRRRRAPCASMRPARASSRSRTCSRRRRCPPRPKRCATAQSLGCDPGAFVFGVFGYLRESKRAGERAPGLRRAAPRESARPRC